MINKKALALLFAASMLAGCDSDEEKAIKFYESGVAYEASGDLESAKIEYANAVKANPVHAQALFAQAKLAEQDQDWQALNKKLQKIIEIDPNHYEARLMFGRFMLLAKQLDQALAQSQFLIENQPLDPESYVLHAGVLNQLADNSGARKAAKKAYELDPNSMGALMMMASFSQVDGNVDQALQYIEQGLAIEPDNLIFSLAKVEGLDFKGESQRAVALLETLVAKQPESAQLNKLLVAKYIKAGQDDKAGKQLDQFARATKSVEGFKAAIGFVNHKSGFEAAKQRLEQYLAEFPTVVGLRFVLVDLYLKTDKIDKAEEVLASIVKDAPDTKFELDALNRTAEIKMFYKDIEGANATLDQVLAKDGQNHDGLINRAKLQLIENKFDQAISTLRSVVKYSPKSYKAYLLLARAHTVQGEPELAETQFNSAYEYGADQFEVVNAFSGYLIKGGQIGRAEEVLEAFLISNPKNTEILKRLAEVKLRLQKWDEAEDVANRLKTIDENDQFIDGIYGQALVGKKDYDGAIQAIKNYKDALPDDSRPIIALVDTYVKAGKRQEAEKFLTDIIKVDQDNYLAHILMAKLGTYYQNDQQVTSHLDQAIKDHPGLPAAYNMLYRYYIKKGDVEQAKVTLEKGVESVEKNTALQLSLADIYQRTEELDKAVDIYESLLAKNPKFEVAANNLAVILSYRNDEASLTRAAKLAEDFRDSEIPEFQDTLGWLYYQQGKYLDAIYLLEKSVLELHGIGEVNYHLGMAYKAVERNEEAKLLLKKAIDSGQKFNGLQEAKAAYEVLSNM